MFEKHRRRAKKKRKHKAPDALAIRELRSRCRFTQAMLARQIGATPLSVLQWESGRRVPSREYAERLYLLADINRMDLDRLGASAGEEMLA
jgi:DNA-binding transcriptional regulator YiaG